MVSFTSIHLRMGFILSDGVACASPAPKKLPVRRDPEMVEGVLYSFLFVQQ